jgi:hypothetical protein
MDKNGQIETTKQKDISIKHIKELRKLRTYLIQLQI